MHKWRTPSHKSSQGRYLKIIKDVTGLTIDQYQIIEELGQSGMTTIYKAFDTRVEAEVAKPQSSDTDKFPPIILDRLFKRFEREAKTISCLTNNRCVGRSTITGRIHKNEFGIEVVV